VLDNYFTGVDIVPSCELERMNALERLQILDTPEEQQFDRITQLLAQVFERYVSPRAGRVFVR